MADPIIKQSPSYVTENPCNYIKFVVIAEGQSPLLYTFYEDDKIIGQSVNNFCFCWYQGNSDKKYKCMVSNKYGEVSTPNWIITEEIDRNPITVHHKVGINKKSITVGKSLKYSTNATHLTNKSLNYRWYLNGQRISYSQPNIDLGTAYTSHNGMMLHCEVSDGYGNIRYDYFKISVSRNWKPVIYLVLFLLFIIIVVIIILKCILPPSDTNGHDFNTLVSRSKNVRSY